MYRVRSCIRSGLYVCLLMFAQLHTIASAISANSQNDPYPVFTTLDPHFFLQTRYKNYLKGLTETEEHGSFSFSISPFGQNACKGKDICGDEVELGDLNGKWAMIGLILGPVPEGYVLPPALVDARNCLYPNVAADMPIDDPFAIDKNQQYGFFSAPMEYKKRGLRVEVLGAFSNSFGIRLQLGFADICQAYCGCSNEPNVMGLQNQTSKATAPYNPTNSNFTEQNINEKLMCNVKDIAEEICWNICNFHKSSIEDIRPALYWAHPYPINNERENWPHFIITPFALLEGSIAVGKERDLNQPAALSFGSNDHHAIGATAGFDIDFTESMEIGCEFGLTHFFDRDFCKVHVPTYACQSGIYPFATAVNIQPGKNWHFGAKLGAYHFIERLSFYFQYLMISHDNDKITLKKPDPAFLPERLEKISTWKVQVANMAFNYDISPNISLGVLWQAPLSQRNAYRSTTVIWCTLNASF